MLYTHHMQIYTNVVYFTKQCTGWALLKYLSSVGTWKRGRNV